jgi:hypothetical protein
MSFRTTCPQLQHQILREGAGEDTIVNILYLSNAIFDSNPDSKYASLNLWKERLSDPSSMIISMTSLPECEKPIAFVFAYPRSHAKPLASGLRKSMHIWLAGVQKDFRGRKCLDTMVDELRHSMDREDATKGTKVAQMLTICTIPARYPSMWHWLQSRKWTVEGQTGDKVLLSFSVCKNAE